MDKIKWIIFALVVVAIFGGVIWVSKSNKVEFTGDAKQVITEGPIADHIFGSQNKKVVVIEYGDFQCPACGKMYQPIKDLKTRYKDKLTFVFRHYPLTAKHPNALAASTAAEAAGLQGKFYEMHDLLYENQPHWESVGIDQRGAVLEGYASQLGLDVPKWKTDLASKDIKAKIDRDKSSASQFKVNHTPTFILNGKHVGETTDTDAAALSKAIEDAIRAAYPAGPPTQ